MQIAHSTASLTVNCLLRFDRSFNKRRSGSSSLSKKKPLIRREEDQTDDLEKHVAGAPVYSVVLGIAFGF